jgi:hypothetical protein
MLHVPQQMLARRPRMLCRNHTTTPPLLITCEADRRVLVPTICTTLFFTRQPHKETAHTRGRNSRMKYQERHACMNVYVHVCNSTSTRARHTWCCCGQAHTSQTPVTPVWPAGHRPQPASHTPNPLLSSSTLARLATPLRCITRRWVVHQQRPHR